MKKKTIGIIVVVCILGVISLVSLFLINTLQRSGQFAFENELTLSKGKTIQARARVGDLAVHKGDLFSYVLEVWYDPGVVTAIDKDNLEKSINLNPFEIKQVAEHDMRLDGNTRLYRREYTLQLVTGNAGQVYEFPDMLVRYEAKGSEGLLSTPVSVEPVYVASRLTGEVRDLVFGYGPLRPVTAKIKASCDWVPWACWSLGLVLAVAGVYLRSRKPVSLSTATKSERRTTRQGGVVFESYRALLGNRAKAAEPRALLHQMDHILRVLLIRQEKIDLLAGIDPARLPAEAQGPAASLLEVCRRAYDTKMVATSDVEEGLSKLDQVLEYYYGHEELAAWRDL